MEKTKVILSDSDDSSFSVSISSDGDDDSDYNESKRKKPQKPINIDTPRHPPRYVGDFREEDLQCPEKMKKIWDIAHKQIAQQRTKLRTITQKNKRLEGQVVRLKNIIRHLKSVHK